LNTTSHNPWLGNHSTKEIDRNCEPTIQSTGHIGGGKKGARKWFMTGLRVAGSVGWNCVGMCHKE
jgi:hypothetical protein